MHEKSRLLIQGTSVYTLTSILTQAGAMLLLPGYTRILSPAEYGIVGLLTPIINFIPLFFIFGIYVAQMRLYADYHKTGEMKEYIFSVNIFLVIVNILVFILLISPAGSYILNLLLDFDKVPYAVVMLALIIGFLKLFTQMGNNYYRTIYALKRIAYANIIGFILSNASAVLMILFMKNGVIGKYSGMLIGTLFMFIVLYIPYISKTGRVFKKKYITASLLIGLPVMINSITSVIINYSDRIVIAKFLPIEVVGVYSIAYTGGLLLTIFIASFNSAWVPMFNELMNSSQNNKFEIVRTRMTDFILILVSLCVAGQLFGVDVIRMILPAEYTNAALFFPYILFGIVFMGINHFLTDIIIYHKRTYYLPILTIVSAAVNLGLNIIFIPIYGPMTAAITTILAYVIISVSLFIIIGVKFKSYSFDYFRMIVILVFSLNPLILHLATNSSLLYIIFKILYLAFFTLIFGKYFIRIMKLWRRDAH